MAQPKKPRDSHETATRQVHSQNELYSELFRVYDKNHTLGTRKGYKVDPKTAGGENFGDPNADIRGEVITGDPKTAGGEIFGV